MTAYCTPCLDVWYIDTARIDRGDWVNIRSGVHLHVLCGRALEAIRLAPPTFVGEFDELERYVA